jgi:hypothetical protein
MANRRSSRETVQAAGIRSYGDLYRFADALRKVVEQ